MGDEAWWQPAWGSEGVPARRGHPRSLRGDCRGPLSPSVRKVFSSSCLPQPFWKLPASSSYCPGSLAAIGKHGREKPRGPPPNPSLPAGWDLVAVFPPALGHLKNILTRIVRGIFMVGSGRFLVFSVKRRFTTSGMKAGKWQVGSWLIKFGVCLSLLLLFFAPRLLFYEHRLSSSWFK